MSNKVSVNEIPLLFEPVIGSNLKLLCERALSYSGNNNEIKNTINQLCLSLTMVSESKFGTASIEVRTIKSILRRLQDEDKFNTKPTFSDPLEQLFVDRYINSTQLEAGQTIRRIWECFNRVLGIQARNYERSIKQSKKKGTSTQPVDIISNKLFSVYREVYTPWFEAAKNSYVVNNDDLNISEAAITLQIVVDMTPPNRVDQSRFLMRGTAKTVLIRQLDMFITLGS